MKRGLSEPENNKLRYEIQQLRAKLDRYGVTQPEDTRELEEG
mgnify:CR=1 FL=1